MFEALKKNRTGLTNTVSFAVGAYDLVRQFRNKAITDEDLKHEETRTLARASRILDASALAVQVGFMAAARITLKSGAAASTITTLASKRVAGPVTLAFEATAGLIQFEIARRKRDAERASDALGTTTGSIAGGTVGAAVGGLPGAIAGSVTGAKVGKMAAEYFLKDRLTEQFKPKTPQ